MISFRTVNLLAAVEGNRNTPARIPLLSVTRAVLAVWSKFIVPVELTVISEDNNSSISKLLNVLGNELLAVALNVALIL